MKCFAILLLLTYSIATISTKNIDENDLTSSGSSIQSLFQTLIQLVKGVLDNDKFVLDILGLTPPLHLTDHQIDDLKRLLKSLNTINADLTSK